MFVKKSFEDLEKEDFFSNLKNKCPSDEEKERIKETFRLIKTENVEQ